MPKKLKKQISDQFFSPKISIIIPIYNVVPYLTECLESVVLQTFKDYECIMVDDGSTDGGEKICDEYASRYEAFKVIHQSNAGLSAARNAGIKKAAGEYIYFLDGDDMIHPLTLETLYEPVKKLAKKGEKIDICFSLYKKFKNFTLNISDLKEEKSSKKSSEITAATFQKIQDFYQIINLPLWMVAHNRIYRKSLFEDIRYPSGRYHEDEFVSYKLFFKAKNIYYSDAKLYFYRKHSASITANFTKKHFEDAWSALKECVGFSRQNHIEALINYTIQRLFKLLEKARDKKILSAFLFRYYVFDYLKIKKASVYKSIKVWLYFCHRRLHKTLSYIKNSLI